MSSEGAAAAAATTDPTTEKVIANPDHTVASAVDKEKSSCDPKTPPSAESKPTMDGAVESSVPPPPAATASSKPRNGSSTRGHSSSSRSGRRTPSNDVPRTVQGSPMHQPQPQYPYGGQPPSYPYGGYPPSPYTVGPPVDQYGRTRTFSGEATGHQMYVSAPMPPQEGTPMSMGGHRRMNSNGSVASASGGGYGSMAAPPSPRAPASPRSDFSPRNEFMNVTGFRPESPRNTPSYPPPSPRGTVYNQSSIPPPPTGAASPYTMAQYSPHHANMMGMSPSYQQQQVTPQSSGMDSVSGGGGEAVFIAQRRSSKTKQESSHRRHMRQQSAQLYMEAIKGKAQPVMCRDVLFMLIFVFHILGMAYLFTTYSKEAFATHDPVQEDTDSVTIYYNNLLIASCFSGLFAITVSTVLLGGMMFFVQRFVQAALCVIITLSFVWGTVGIGLSPQNFVPITGIIALALAVAYTIIVWDRIPFAASNLATALSAIRAFPGTIIVALFFQALGCAWCIYFTVIVFGIYDSIQDGRIVLSPRLTIFAYVLLGISFYWTFQVLLNVVQVATAGVIGSWWSQPDGDHTVKRSTMKTIFYSFGSVCFGSLFVGPVKIIRQFSVLFRPSSDEASLLCLHECLQCFRTCITSFVEGLAARFNPWAFTYIGLYGYGFLEAGQMATDLFDKRGWTTIVSDDLVPNVLLMTSLVVGGVTGCFGYLMGGLQQLHVTSVDEPHMVSFIVGVVMGLVTTSILFGAISSSVNAVIVCFATSPVDFEQNHPQLSRDMREAWRTVWPGALDVMDIRMAMAEVNGTPTGSVRKMSANDSTMVPLL